MPPVEKETYVIRNAGGYSIKWDPEIIWVSFFSWIIFEVKKFAIMGVFDGLSGTCMAWVSQGVSWNKTVGRLKVVIFSRRSNLKMDNFEKERGLVFQYHHFFLRAWQFCRWPFWDGENVTLSKVKWPPIKGSKGHFESPGGHVYFFWGMYHIKLVKSTMTSSAKG